MNFAGDSIPKTRGGLKVSVGIAPLERKSASFRRSRPGDGILGSTLEFHGLVAASQTVIWLASRGPLLQAVTFLHDFYFQPAGLANPNLIQFQVNAA